MTKPTDVLRWSSASPGTTRDEPSSGEKDTGWIADEIPTSGETNWLIGVAGDWSAWLNTRLYDAYTIPTDAVDVRLYGDAGDGLIVRNTAGTLIPAKVGVATGTDHAWNTRWCDRAAANNSGTVSIPHNAETQITFATEEYDSGGLYDDGGSEDRFTIATTGYYRATCWVSMDAGSVVDKLATLAVKSNAAVVGKQSSLTVGQAQELCVTADFAATAGHLVIATILHTNGSSAAINRTYARMSVTRIA